MTGRAGWRASDADREQVAERLRVAATEGRLEAEEFEERLATTFSARTYGELDRVVADLPAPPAPRRREPAFGLRPGVAVAIAVVLVFVLLSSISVRRRTRARGASRRLRHLGLGRVAGLAGDRMALPGPPPRRGLR